MSLLLIQLSPKPLIINVDQLNSATYDEEEGSLIIILAGGNTLALDGECAISVWSELKALSDQDDEEDEDEDEERDDNEDEDIARDELSSIADEISELEKQIARSRVDFRDVHSLRGSIEFLGRYWEPKVRILFNDEFSMMREKAYETIKAAEITYYTQIVNECAKVHFTRSSAMKTHLTKLEAAEDSLIKKGYMTDDLQSTIRNVKERLAWYCAQKKLNEVEVLIAGGNHNKASKLRLEAREILKQDWAVIFPNEDPPVIE